jgi:ElaB/YqjD/DUF883 family membrane-anchored ribosome-binding protein
MSTATDKTYEDLSKQIESLKTDLSKLTAIMGELGKAETDRLMAAAKSRGEALKATGEARYTQARQTAEGYIRDGERYVQEQPGTALGIAAAVGFIVGFLMTSRR